MNLGSVLRQLGSGYSQYERGRDQNVWKAFEDALLRQNSAEMELDSALNQPVRPALTHEQAFHAGITAAIAALLGAKPESLNRAVGSYVHGVQSQKEAGEQRRLQRLARRASTASDISGLELARARVAADALESSRRRSASIQSEQRRTRDAGTQAERDREARLAGIRLQSESKQKSDQARAATSAEAQKSRSRDAQVRELADLFLGLLAAQTRAPHMGGLGDQAQSLMDELLKRLGVSRELRPLKVVPISGPIGGKGR